jgi:hypothetical protein
VIILDALEDQAKRAIDDARTAAARVSAVAGSFKTAVIAAIHAETSSTGTDGASPAATSGSEDRSETMAGVPLQSAWAAA